MTVETLAQLATSSLAAARVLEQHEIDYCKNAGDSLASICAAQGLDLAAIQQELAAAAEEDPDERDWTTAPLRDLTRFLQEEHVWLRAEMTLLQRRLAATAAAHADTHPELEHLGTVFARLCDDMNIHMHHEEVDVFPAVDKYLDAVDQGIPLPGSPLSAFGGPLRMMETEHDSCGAALRLLREFARNYDVPEDACPRYQVLIRGMAGLEDRLLRHIYLENNVLFARAARLRPGQARVTR